MAAAPIDAMDRFFNGIAATPLAPHQDALRAALNENPRRHGKAAEWDRALAAATEEPAASYDFTTDTVRIGEEQSPLLPDELITAFHPWRKGPFLLRGTFIDAEWRSDRKWRRIAPHISRLEGRYVLDVGCGNGYYLLRMLGDGARLALGVDPTLVYNYQFSLLQTQLPNNSAYLLPLRSEQFPRLGCFDTAFSLGLLYHRRSPLDHLLELKEFLRPGGELVLETLVVAGNDRTVLMPDRRYAKMGNVFFIPSAGFLEKMVARTGFINARTVDIHRTGTEEQRATRWMTFQSLADFLDPHDASLTVEGYPAPERAILVAEKPAASRRRWKSTPSKKNC